MSIEEQLDQLERCAEAFAGSVAALDESLFLREVTSWTPRDIVAHLIGWNQYVVRGAGQILRGQLPFYDVDPGPDYSRINAALVRACADTDRTVLLNSLAASTRELTVFLRAVDPDAWNRDYGVRHGGETLTVKSTVDDLIGDYDHHRVQLENFRHVIEAPGKRLNQGR